MSTSSSSTKNALQLAYIGMQCFWGVESSFARLPGVRKTKVGYAGGTTLLPTYYNIGDHTEITELQFDPSLNNYDDILEWFFSHHNPTQIHKKQYKSAILYVDDEQKNSANMAVERAKKKYGPNLDTYVQKLDNFYPAEDYHQKYWLRTQTHIYKELNLTDSEMIDSPLAAKLNAFLGGGFLDFDVLRDLQKEYGLSESLSAEVKKIALAGGIGNCH